MPMPQGYTKICKAMHTVRNDFYFILKIINEVHFQILYIFLSLGKNLIKITLRQILFFTVY